MVASQHMPLVQRVQASSSGAARHRPGSPVVPVVLGSVVVVVVVVLGSVVVVVLGPVPTLSLSPLVLVVVSGPVVGVPVVPVVDALVLLLASVPELVVLSPRSRAAGHGDRHPYARRPPAPKRRRSPLV